MEACDRREMAETGRSQVLTDRGELTADQRQQIWDGVSEFIEKQLHANKGVTIANFGTFGFCQSKCDVGGNQYLLVQRPVFQAAERFLQTLGIQQRKCNPVAGEVPLVVINYAQIAIATSFGRGDVERCVKEALQTLSREIAANRDVSFTFRHIGKLKVHNGLLKMRFFKDFVHSLDSTGKSVAAMQNRPGTADSVMSRAESDLATSRGSSSTKLGYRPMQTIDEDQELPFSKDDGNSSAGIDQASEGDKKTDRPVTRQNNRAPLPLSTAANYSINEVAQNSTSRSEFSQSSRKADDSRRGSEVDPTEFIASKTMEEREAIFNDLPKPMPPPQPSSRPRTSMGMASSRPSLQPLDANNNTKHPLDFLPSRIGERPRTASSIRAKTAAEEAGNAEGERCASVTHSEGSLCCACGDREKRNIPISFQEDNRLRDVVEDQLFDAYHQINVTNHILQEREKELEKRYKCQKDAAFNLGVAAAQRSDRDRRPVNEKYQPSFLFRRRARTPPKYLKQQVVSSVLLDQINHAQQHRSRLAEEESFIDKLERLQNEQELARNRMEEQINHASRTENYKVALHLQSQMRKERQEADRALAKELEDKTEAVFCDIDGQNAAQQHRELRDKAIAERHLQDIIRKKREALIDRIRKQAEESDMLKRNATETAQECADRYARRMRANRQLENEWLHAADMKMSRDSEEMRDRLHSPVGMLLEQLVDHKRCKQCQRKLSNCGESHIYSDSHYTNGSRFIV